jgi:dihydroorotate dehydrogenase (NAD+) catalytic subunit
VGPLAVRTPLIAASGTCAFGEELGEFGVLPALGAFVTKTITPEPRRGNPPPRTCEARAGLLNSIGLANPGLGAFRRDVVPRLAELPCPCVVNIGGASERDYVETARALSGEAAFAAMELNLSCPNVTGGLDLSRSRQALGRVTRAVRGVWDRPLWVKLTPNVTDIRALVEEAASSGADAAVVANTHLAMSIDWRTRRSRLGRPVGGLSGPAIKPITVRLTWEAASCGALPIVASGGAVSAEDVLELMTAGASAVELGTVLLRDPVCPPRLAADLARLLAAEGIARISDLIGSFTREEA